MSSVTSLVDQWNEIELKEQKQQLKRQIIKLENEAKHNIVYNKFVRNLSQFQGVYQMNTRGNNFITSSEDDDIEYQRTSKKQNKKKRKNKYQETNKYKRYKKYTSDDDETNESVLKQLNELNSKIEDISSKQIKCETLVVNQLQQMNQNTNDTFDSLMQFNKSVNINLNKLNDNLKYLEKKQSANSNDVRELLSQMDETNAKIQSINNDNDQMNPKRIKNYTRTQQVSICYTIINLINLIIEIHRIQQVKQMYHYQYFILMT